MFSFAVEVVAVWSFPVASPIFLDLQNAQLVRQFSYSGLPFAYLALQFLPV